MRDTTQSWERPVADASQTAIEQALAQLQSNSESLKQITKSIASLITLDLRPYSVMENVGLWTMVFTLEPRFKIPSQVSSLTTAIPMLYSETKTKVLATLMRAGR